MNLFIKKHSLGFQEGWLLILVTSFLWVPLAIAALAGMTLRRNLPR